MLFGFAIEPERSKITITLTLFGFFSDSPTTSKDSVYVPSWLSVRFFVCGGVSPVAAETVITGLVVITVDKASSKETAILDNF